MEFNRPAIAAKCEVIARVLDLPVGGFDGLYAWVLALRQELGIAHTLAEIGVTLDRAKVIGAEAAIDPSASGNPIPVTAADLERIFRAAVAGQRAAAA
jgi:alcohol dehydrogenase class IV